jgi:ubiquinone/menaquinone biosynthesis C-methylase UbiE
LIHHSQTIIPAIQTEAVNRAFSKQSLHFDDEDKANPVLLDMRKQIYEHIATYMQPASYILELNAGTGIDALYFVSLGHRVYATDLSTGMIDQINNKISQHHVHDNLFCRQLSYDQLDQVKDEKFDYVFSNFGGLNCIDDLSQVTRHLPTLLNKGAHVTWVIMPPVCLWEWMGVVKGNVRGAFRRFKKSGVKSHLEGEFFQTYYHSLSQIQSAFGSNFKFIKTEGLASLSPQPHRGDFPARYPRLYKGLRQFDSLVRNRFPFNRWADHIIVTFQYNP